jgi:LacI family transcriptional regulator
VDESLIVPGAHARDLAYRNSQALLRRADPPTAIFSASDRGAVNAIWAARDLGRAVPDDIAVIGVGNSLEGAAIRPGLTTAGPRSIGFDAVIDLLWRRIEHPGATETELHTPWELIVRASS